MFDDSENSYWNITPGHRGSFFKINCCYLAFLSRIVYLHTEVAIMFACFLFVSTDISVHVCTRVYTSASFASTLMDLPLLCEGFRFKSWLNCRAL